MISKLIYFCCIIVSSNLQGLGNTKISLITVAFNAGATIEKCINSVIAQQYPDLEYIIIDGSSADDTLSIINKYKNHISKIISEPDRGIYDAMNKGIELATGNIVGILNADDYFAGNDVLERISHAFETSGADIIYGDIDYINRKGNIIRMWRSGTYIDGAFNKGWMPPHPSFYVKRILLETFGGYQPGYGSATDYELMLRYIHKHKCSVHYLRKVFVKMLIGGVSNHSFKNRINAWTNDFRAMRNNDVRFPLMAIIMKPLRKITQYIR